MSDRKGDYFWAWALTNLGIIALVTFALYFTHSLWSFFGLLFLFSTRSKTVNTKCPKCDHEFIAVEKNEEDEEKDE